MKKILSLVLALMMVLMMVPMAAGEEFAAQGVAGELEWRLDAAGLLTISGTGAIFTDSYWASYKNQIKTVVIEDGVTSIGKYAFSGCSSLESVTIPGSVTIIGNYAFSGCSSLESVTIPGSVTEIGSFAFYGCSSLITVRYEGTTEPQVRNYAFVGCPLKKVYVPTGYLGDTFGDLNVDKTLDVTPPDKPTYTVTVTPDDNGTALADPASGAEGTEVTLTVTPNDGYELVDVTANGTNVTINAEGKGSFFMPKENVTVVVNFKKSHSDSDTVETVPGEPATCEQDGVMDYYKCSCGRFYKDQACMEEILDPEAWKTGAGKIETKGHDYGEWILAQDAVHTQTLLSAAVGAHYYCDVCDTYFVDGDEGTMVKTTLGALTGEMPAHDTEAWVNTDKEQHWKKCSVCGLEDTTTAATHDFENDRDTTCDTCGYVRTVSGGATGDTPGAQRPAYPTYWPVVDETTTGAAAEEHFMVLCRKLNVRAGAGTAFAKVGSLARGAMVHGKALDNGWIQIEYEGKTAYISAQYAELLEDAACEKTVTVICRKLNVRTGAGTNYSKVGSVMRGDELCVVSEKDGWYEVLYEDGTAWVSAQYVA